MRRLLLLAALTLAASAAAAQQGLNDRPAVQQEPNNSPAAQAAVQQKAAPQPADRSPDRRELPARNDYGHRYTRSLHDVLTRIADRFGLRLKCEVDTAGLRLPYADSRIRPYSIEETLDNVLKPFDFKFVKQNPRYYKIKPYEPHRRPAEEGAELLEWLAEVYADSASFERRKRDLRRDVRALTDIDRLLAACVRTEPLWTKARRYDGYSVQNFRLETLPGLYVCGSVYLPDSDGKHPVILSPDGHAARYIEQTQRRLASWARMGAIAVSYDLAGYGESALQIGAATHHSPIAQLLQLMNGIRILDMMLARREADPTRVGLCGASGGGTQTMQLAVLDDRYTAICPVISLSSYFDGGCACESGIQLCTAGGGTCNAELAATFAPRPLGVVSDGGDWTACVPTQELPYLRAIYSLYGAADRLRNWHFAEEGHDFGPSKRAAVCDFFAEIFGLDRARADETKCTVEPTERLLLFGPDGDGLPAGAIRSAAELAPWFEAQAVADAVALNQP